MSVSINIPFTIDEPNPDGFTVYTKQYCIFCDRVKALFDKEKIAYTVIVCDSYLEYFKGAFLHFIKERSGIDYKTFPIVFYKGRFIGGFTDTETFVIKENAFANIELGENDDF